MGIEMSHQKRFEFHDIIRRSLEFEREKKNKLLPLEEAIKGHVKPGMKLHLAGGFGGPSAAICQIIREYQGKNPEFTLIQSTLSGHALNLAHCQLIKKLIFTACVDISDSARPSKIIQKAYEEKRIELENWSLCSLQQRLMAGALGFPFLPNQSILGSSIAVENKELFREIADPFEPQTKVGVVKALNPDISIVQGCVADVQGNTILSAPYGDDLWGSLASTHGVLITVEKIVPTDFIRKYSSLVKIPNFIVKAVSLAPMGMHPFSLVNPGISDFEDYGMDNQFLKDLHQASMDDATLDAWIKEWVIDCPTQEQYLTKLGSEKILGLKKIGKETQLSEFSYPAPSPSSQTDYTAEEMMLIVLSREVMGSVKRSQHGIILVGAGSRAIAAWLAYYQLRAEGYEIELITGNGQIGYTPQPGESFLQSPSGIRSSKMLTDSVMTQGVFVGGRNNKCLSVLGAGQIDSYGNINSTKTSGNQFLMGSGGANDAASAREVIVVLDQSRNRFVETLPYITCRGDRVTTVVSTMGVYRKKGRGEKLHLAAYFPDSQAPTPEQKIKQIQDHCGWPLMVAAKVEEIPNPTPTELQLLRWLLSPSGSKTKR
jgi:acyl CoA:acetate/3-ketoacid CoA transferase alpha subunit/acyl CoA:acetate/3-ketoacid CoA transferase beta subunit